MGLKVIITGVTGLVGEGALLECIQNNHVDSVLAVSRKPIGIEHLKLKNLVVADFSQLDETRKELQGYDACFYCAGVSSVGLSEEEYSKITYDTTVKFAGVILKLNPKLVFCFVSGASTDGSGKGRVMWARVKGKTENELQRMMPGREFNLRPGLMKPMPGQKHLYHYNRYMNVLYPILKWLIPSCPVRTVARAMISIAQHGSPKSVLEVRDIKQAGV